MASAGVLDSDSAYRIGNVALIEGEYNRAIEFYSHAISLNPGLMQAYYGRAFSRGLSRDYNGAISDFSRVLELNPSCAQAHLGRALAYSYINAKGLSGRDLRVAGSMSPEIARDLSQGAQMPSIKKYAFLYSGTESTIEDILLSAGWKTPQERVYEEEPEPGKAPAAGQPQPGSIAPFTAPLAGQPPPGSIKLFTAPFAEIPPPTPTPPWEPLRSSEEQGAPRTQSPGRIEMGVFVVPSRAPRSPPSTAPVLPLDEAYVPPAPRRSSRPVRRYADLYPDPSSMDSIPDSGAGARYLFGILAAALAVGLAYFLWPSGRHEPRERGPLADYGSTISFMEDSIRKLLEGYPGEGGGRTIRGPGGAEFRMGKLISLFRVKTTGSNNLKKKCAILKHRVTGKEDRLPEVLPARGTYDVDIECITLEGEKCHGVTSVGAVFSVHRVSQSRGIPVDGRPESLELPAIVHIKCVNGSPKVMSVDYMWLRALLDSSLRGVSWNTLGGAGSNALALKALAGTRDSTEDRKNFHHPGISRNARSRNCAPGPPRPGKHMHRKLRRTC
jgi:hypothetical protein